MPRDRILLLWMIYWSVSLVLLAYLHSRCLSGLAYAALQVGPCCALMLLERIGVWTRDPLAAVVV